MKFTLSFNTDNDAFYDDENGEIARILRDLADRIDRGDIASQHRNASDRNGNIIGTYVLKEAA
jgi:hypothetical protein